MSSSFGKNEVMFRRRGLSSKSHKFVVVVVMMVPTAVMSGADGTGTTFGRLGDRVVSLSISNLFACFFVVVCCPVVFKLQDRSI